MTNKERDISRYNKMKARKRFGILGKKDLVLHHKDPTLRHNNIERYIQWNDEDLEVMNVAEHTRLHHLHSKHSEETKRKISQSSIGKKMPVRSEEYRHKMSLAQKGHEVSMETRRKISEGHKGKPSLNKGKKWFTNGITEFYGFDCPEGFEKGRLKK